MRALFIECELVSWWECCCSAALSWCLDAIPPNRLLSTGVCSTTAYMKMIPSEPAEKTNFPQTEACRELTSPKCVIVSPYLCRKSSRRNRGGMPWTIKLPRLVAIIRFSISCSADTTLMTSLKQRTLGLSSSSVNFMQVFSLSPSKIRRTAHSSFLAPTMAI